MTFTAVICISMKLALFVPFQNIILVFSRLSFFTRSLFYFSRGWAGELLVRHSGT